MIKLKLLFKTLSVASSIVLLVACGDGPAEDAGEKVDEAITDAGNAIEDTCEDVKESTGAKDDDC